MGKDQGRDGGEYWLQRLIASALMMGISKRELMEDYYYNEIGEVIQAWNRLHGAENEEKEVDAMAFMGGGGEVLG